MGGVKGGELERVSESLSPFRVAGCRRASDGIIGEMRLEWVGGV